MVNGQRDVPARESRSLWFRPQARTSITTSSAPGTGSSSSSQRITSGPPYSRKVAARMSVPNPGMPAYAMGSGQP